MPFCIEIKEKQNNRKGCTKKHYYRKIKIFSQSKLILTTQPGRPVADSTNGIVAQTLGTGVFPSDNSPDFHLGTGDELLTRQRMGEVTLIQALDDSRSVHNHLDLGATLADDSLFAVVVVIVVQRRPIGATTEVVLLLAMVRRRIG